MKRNSFVKFFREVLEKLVPFFLGLSVGKNKSVENANDLVKKAKRNRNKIIIRLIEVLIFLLIVLICLAIVCLLCYIFMVDC